MVKIEIRLLNNLQKAFSSAFENIEGGYCFGSYTEVLQAVNSVSNDNWKDNDFDVAINALINKGLFAFVFGVESRQLKSDYTKYQGILTFTEHAQEYMQLIKLDEEISENSILCKLRGILERHSQQDKDIEVETLIDMLVDNMESIDKALLNDKIVYFIDRLIEDKFLSKNSTRFVNDNTILHFRLYPI